MHDSHVSYKVKAKKKRVNLDNNHTQYVQNIKGFIYKNK